MARRERDTDPRMTVPTPGAEDMVDSIENNIHSERPTIPATPDGIKAAGEEPINKQDILSDSLELSADILLLNTAKIGYLNTKGLRGLEEAMKGLNLPIGTKIDRAKLINAFPREYIPGFDIIFGFDLELTTTSGAKYNVNFSTNTKSVDSFSFNLQNVLCDPMSVLMDFYVPVRYNPVFKKAFQFGAASRNSLVEICKLPKGSDIKQLTVKNFKDEREFYYIKGVLEYKEKGSDKLNKRNFNDRIAKTKISLNRGYYNTNKGINRNYVYGALAGVALIALGYYSSKQDSSTSKVSPTQQVVSIEPKNHYEFSCSESRDKKLNDKLAKGRQVYKCQIGDGDFSARVKINFSKQHHKAVARIVDVEGKPAIDYTPGGFVYIIAK